MDCDWAREISSAACSEGNSCEPSGNGVALSSSETGSSGSSIKNESGSGTSRWTCCGGGLATIGNPSIFSWSTGDRTSGGGEVRELSSMGRSIGTAKVDWAESSGRLDEMEIELRSTSGVELFRRDNCCMFGIGVSTPTTIEGGNSLDIKPGEPVGESPAEESGGVKEFSVEDDVKVLCSPDSLPSSPAELRRSETDKVSLLDPDLGEAGTVNGGGSGRVMSPTMKGEGATGSPWSPTCPNTRRMVRPTRLLNLFIPLSCIITRSSEGFGAASIRKVCYNLLGLSHAMRSLSKCDKSMFAFMFAFTERHSFMSQPEHALTA